MEIIYTNDGKKHIVYSTRDMYWLIDEYMGSDTVRYIDQNMVQDNEIEQLKAEIDDLRSDLEIERNDTYTLLVELRDIIDEAIDGCEQPRTNKKELIKKLRYAYNMINEVL